MIASFSGREKHVETLQFAKVSTPYEQVFQKFSGMYASGQIPSTGVSADTVIYKLLAGKLTSSSGELVDEKDRQVAQDITRILTYCWECRPLQKLDKDQFRELMMTRKGRKIFSECMNYYRKNGIFSMKEKAYTAVVELMYTALSLIQEDNDVESALNILILSQTFHLEQKSDGKTEKIFLQMGIQSHPFWQNRTLWEKAVSSEEDIQADAVPDESEAEKKSRVDSMIFGKLSTFCHNMLEFRMAKQDVEQIIFTYATKKSLPEPYIDMLRVHSSRLKTFPRE